MVSKHVAEPMLVIRGQHPEAAPEAPEPASTAAATTVAAGARRPSRPTPEPRAVPGVRPLRHPLEPKRLGRASAENASETEPLPFAEGCAFLTAIGLDLWTLRFGEIKGLPAKPTKS